MTISTTDSRISYNGNSVTTVFSFPYRFLANGDLVVVSVSSTGVETVKVLTTDYTVTGAGDDGGGSVTMLAAPATGTRLIIYRDTDIVQETDYISGDPFPAETHERALDLLTMVAQEIGSDADRSIKVPVGDSSSLSTVLPAAANRLDKFIVFDATTGALELSTVTQTQVASAVAAAYAAGATADAVTFLQGSTGAVSESVQVALRRFVHVDQFNPTADGATDDLTPLTNFINSAIANPGVPHWLGNATYATSGSLPTITANNVLIYGGTGGNRDVGNFTGSVIKAIAGCTGTMLTVAPATGASAQAMHGFQLMGVTFDCNSIAAKGVILKSIRNYDIDIAVHNATTDGLTFDVVTTLGEAKDIQRGRIRYVGRQAEAASGVSLRLKGDTVANTSFNNFEIVDILHTDATGIICENSDNNVWQSCRVLRSGSGTATNSIEWRGGATSAESCRSEYYLSLSTTVAAIAKGTGTYTVGATDIVIDNIDTGNGTPVPTEETGTKIYDGRWRTTSPTPVAGSGSFTSVSCTLRYQRMLRRMHIGVALTITTNGTANGNIQVALPASAPNNTGSGAILAGTNTTDGLDITGLVAQNSSTLVINKYDGTYPGASGKTYFLSGSFETA